ncbi:putative membrane protein [Nakamurella sp. UYEF19]|uniref:PH domain-containing protein n=1 Tax=Nakamurella sp. UYEF19 TaxID=1756392 RepID=UPI00339513A6
MTPDPAMVATPAAAPAESRTISERRLHPAYLLISFGRNLRSLIPLIAVGIWQAPGWSIGALAGVVVLLSVANWWVKKYSVRDGSLRVRSGLFRRTQDIIGINRITALDAERGVVQRICGVWGLKIQTPGNNHRASVHLACLSASALEELRVALAQPGPMSSADGPIPSGLPLPSAEADAGTESLPAGTTLRKSANAPVPETLAVLGTRTLLIAAFTGTSIPLMLAGAAATIGRARDLLPEQLFRRITREVFTGGPTTALLLLAAVAVAVFAGIGLTSLRLARFTLVREGERLRISRGLIAQRSGTIPVDRVQAVRVVEGWWRRLLGYCALEVEVAGLSSSNDTERMLFPLIRVDQAAELVGRALPELGWRPAPIHRVPVRARRRYFTLPVLLALPPTLGLAFLPGWGAYLAYLPIPLALLVGWGQAADAGWLLEPDTVTLRWRRVLARHTVIARRERVQLTEITRTPLQRRAGLGGVRLLLSSRRKARVRHLEFDDAVLVQHRVGRRSTGFIPSSTMRDLDLADRARDVASGTYREA